MAHTPVRSESSEVNGAHPSLGRRDETPSSPGAALLEELGRFVRHASHQPDPLKKDPLRLSLWQMAGLLGVTLDLALLYVNFQELFDNPLLLLALKVLPWLLGAAVLPFYSELLRDRTLGLCRHWTVTVVSVLIALPLLLARQPVFSVLVSVNAASITIEASDPKDKLDISEPEDKVFRVVTPDLLKPYKIVVSDPMTETTMISSPKGRSHPFSTLLRRRTILRCTLAQIPVIGWIFGRPRLTLTPLYAVPTDSIKEGAHVVIGGNFEEGYIDSLRRSGDGVCLRRARKLGLDQIWCNVGKGDDALYLPPGTYDLTLYRDVSQCGPYLAKIQDATNSTIDFDKPCPK